MTESDKKELDSILKTFEKSIKERFEKSIKERFEDLEKAMFLKLSSVIIASVTVAFFALVWLFDFRQDFITEHNQARFEKLENAVYTPSNEAILNEIRDLKMQFSAIQGGHLRFHTAGDKRKQQGTKRKINDVGSRELSSVKEESH